MNEASFLTNGLKQCSYQILVTACHQNYRAVKNRERPSRALITSPKILLLDEPLSALDANLRVRLREELRKIHSKIGTTFICVTHDQEEAMALSDRIAILKEGKLEQMGSPNELYDEPKTEFVAEFFGKCALWPLNKKDGNTLLAGTDMECNVRNGLSLGKSKAVIRPEFLKIFTKGKKTKFYKRKSLRCPVEGIKQPSHYRI